jgi:DNA-binding NarL/FixJ family response regulator
LLTHNQQLTAVIKIVADGSVYLDAKIADCVLTNVVSKTPILTEEEVNEGKTYGFSQREIQVLKLLAQGKNNAEIAKMLNLSVNTVKGHIRRILTKMSVSDRLKAVVKALELGIV